MPGDYENENNEKYDAGNAAIDTASDIARDNYGQKQDNGSSGQGDNSNQGDHNDNGNGPGSTKENQGSDQNGSVNEGVNNAKEASENGENVKSAGEEAGTAGEAAKEGGKSAAEGIAEAGAEAGEATAETGAEAAGTAATGPVGATVSAVKHGIQAALSEASDIGDTSGKEDIDERAGNIGQLILISAIVIMGLAYSFGFFARRESSAQNENYREVTLSKEESGLEAGDGDDNAGGGNGSGYPGGSLTPGDGSTGTGEYSEGMEGVSTDVRNMIDIGLSYVGKARYVYGGTSIENGIDCSAFVQYLHRTCMGISIPRTSKEQAKGGKEVSSGDLRPGDLLFYGNGQSVSHVAMYIGGGQIVHASNPKDGIKTSKYDYREIITARRYT